jgi:hypothetical protein
MTLPENTDFETIIMSQWVNKSVNDSIAHYRDGFRKTLIESIEYAP